VNAAKLITEVVTAATSQVIPAAEPVVAAVSTPVSAAKPKVLKELHNDTPAETQSVKDKGKGILVEDPKPMKKEDQIAMDAEYARKLQEEEESLAQTKDAQATDVQPKDAPAKRIQYIRRYHGYKKKPQSESEARKNMIATLKNMFEKTDAQDVLWRSQQTEHGQALVKSWKLLTSCGVHIITFTTTVFILLVEKKYPLSRFTLEQLVNVARL
nr:hypothetical protein [Tanacetum cinerariifolium]